MEVVVIRSFLVMGVCSSYIMLILAIFSWFFLAVSYEITKSITVLKNLKGHSFRKLSTKLSLCIVSIELYKKLGASQHLSFLIFST